MLAENSTTPSLTGVRRAKLIAVFLLAYLGGISLLVWFNTRMLGLGDPKARASVMFDFPLFAAFYFPAMLVALWCLFKLAIENKRVGRAAAIFVFLIFAAFEATYVLDMDGWPLLIGIAMQTLILGAIFSRARRWPLLLSSCKEAEKTT
jgi:hypothetical protein